MQPIAKRCKALGISPAVMGYAKKTTNRNPGSQMKKKKSEYSLQLTEKQKVKFIYGILEKQFRGYYETAAAAPGKTGDNLLITVERRLDNVVYRMGFAMTRRQARQLVSHAHFTVNGKKVNVPSYLVKAGDVIEVAESSRSTEVFKRLMGQDAPVFVVPTWMERDKNSLKGTVVHQDERVRHKVGKAHIRALCEGIGRIRYDHHILLRFKDLDELRVEDLRVERVDHVQLVLDEHLCDGCDVARVQVDLHVREALVKERDNVGKRRRQQRVQRADAHRAAKFRIRRGKRACPRDRADHVARVGDKVLAVLRDGDCFADAVKELHAELALKLLDLHRHGGLGIVERFGSAGKTFEFRNLQKGDQIANLHTGLQFGIYNGFLKIYYWKYQDLSIDLLQIIMKFFKKDGEKDRLHRAAGPLCLILRIPDAAAHAPALQDLRHTSR